MEDKAIYKQYHNRAVIYDKEISDTPSGRYVYQQQRAFLARYIPYNTPMTATLNLGCGTGRLMEYASYGLDRIPDMINAARKSYPDKEFVISDAGKTEFDDGTFDFIFSFHLLTHIEKEKCRSILKEAHRIIRKGGYYIFDVSSTKGEYIHQPLSQGGHGATRFSIDELTKGYLEGWKLVAYEGLLFLPVYRVPQKIYAGAVTIDRLLCRSALRDYSSSLMIVLQKI